MAKSILCAALAIALSACGGGGADQPAASPAQAPAQGGATCTPRVVTVSLLGDSTMAGQGGRIQRAMDEQFGVGATVVTNFAVSGTTSGQANRIAADVIVANYGINDGKQGVPVDQYRANMLALHPTLIETQSPVIGPTWPEVDYVSASTSAAADLGVPVADTYAYVRTVPHWQTYVEDGTHPDETMYNWISINVLAPAVAAQVAPLRCR